MPKYNLRSWAEQTLFDCRDYVVTADSLADAVALLEQIQEDAEYGDKRIEHPAIVAFDKYQLDGVGTLDPCDVIDGSGGITLLDPKGERARDLIGVPSGCVRLGEPLEPAELEPADKLAAAAPELLAALLDMLAHPRPAETGHCDTAEGWTARYKAYEAAWERARVAVRLAGVVF
jgi:hypothetical protein